MRCLTAHMIEHLLLMSAIPMLLVVWAAGGAVAAWVAEAGVAMDRWAADSRDRVTACDALAGYAGDGVAGDECGVSGWHVPAAYNLRWRMRRCMTWSICASWFTSLLFWWYIIRPWPAKARPDDWGMLVYLAMGDVVMTLLSAFLAFCDRPVYSYYVQHPNPFHIPVLEDQVLGAVVMWVIGSFAYLVPAMVITFRLTGWSDRVVRPVALGRLER